MASQFYKKSSFAFSGDERVDLGAGGGRSQRDQVRQELQLVGGHPELQQTLSGTFPDFVENQNSRSSEQKERSGQFFFHSLKFFSSTRDFKTESWLFIVGRAQAELSR